MKILITGSQGLIGTALMPLLTDHEIIEVDRKISPSQDLMNINGKFFKDLPTDIDLVLHLASNARVRDSVTDPTLAKENILTTYNIINLCVERGIKRFMFSSSRETYGNQNLPSCSEEDAKIQTCESPYGASKVLGEAYVHATRICYDMKPIIVRLSNVFGLNDPNYRFIPILFDKIPKGETVEIYGEGKNMDFTYIDDCVSGIKTVIDNYDRLAEEENPTFNIAYGNNEKLYDVAVYVKKLYNSDSEIKVTENLPGEVISYRANINKITSLTDWRPKVSVYDGLKKMYEEL